MNKPFDPDKHASMWPLAFLGVVVSALSLFASRRYQPGKSIHPQDSPDNKNTDAHRQTAPTTNVVTTPPDSAKTNGSKHDTPLWEKFAVGIAFALLIVNICQMRSTEKAATAAVTANTNAQNALAIAEQAYITVGRPDGTVAEIIRPNGPESKSSIVAYFQNSGHQPARFNWGTWGPMWGLAFIPKSATGSIEVKSGRLFTPMWAGVNRKTGGVGSSGTITIGGSSIYAVPIVELPKQDLDKMLRESDPALELSGMFDYCDSLGNYSCRTFTIQYVREPLDRFVLSYEEECPAFETKLRHPDPDIDYFPACELASRERKMEEDARSRRR